MVLSGWVFARREVVMLRLFLSWVAVATLCCAQAWAVEAIWIGPANGSWGTAANWSTGVVPNNSAQTVRIDDNPVQSSRVESTSNASIGALWVNSGDTLAVLSGTTTAASPVQIDGTLSLTGGKFSTGLVTVGPTGQVELSGAAAQLTSGAVVMAGGVIHGGGTLTGLFLNAGIVRADLAATPLTIQANTVASNDGKLMAVNGGWLKITKALSAGFTSFTGGRVEAHPDSRVTIQGALWDGTVFKTVDDNDPNTAAPVFEIQSGAFTNTTFDGQFRLIGGVMEIAGTITNLGEMRSVYPASGMSLYRDAYLTGGGTVWLNTTGPPSPTAFTATDNGMRITNVDNFIHGGGYLLGATGRLALTNRSTIEADFDGNTTLLVLANSDVTHINSGTMRAKSGGHLRLAGNSTTGTGRLENFEGGVAGRIIAGENSVVEISAMTIVGGILKGEGNDPQTRGKFDGGGVLKDVTIQGTFENIGSAAQFSGQIVNQGTIVGPITISDTAQFTGNGEIVLTSNSLTLAGTSTVNVTATLINQQNLIHGSGTIKASGVTLIVNRGIFRADDMMILNSSLITNAGRLEAATGKTLNINVNRFDNFEGTTGGVVYAANGGTVVLSGGGSLPSFRGGTLETAGTGVIKVGSTLPLTNFRNKGNLELSGTPLSGEIVNDGVIKKNGVINSYLRLSGNGTWEMTGLSLQSLPSQLQNGPQHTILWQGTCGDGRLAIRNEGTIKSVTNTKIVAFGLSLQNFGLFQIQPNVLSSSSLAFTRTDNFGNMIFDPSSAFLTVSAPDGFYNQSGGLIEIDSEIVLNTQTTLTNRSGGLVTGGGMLSQSSATVPALVNEGTVAPGEGITSLDIRGKYQQSSSGKLLMDIATASGLSNDLLAVNGLVALSGKLEVVLHPGDTVAIGNSFKLLTATAGITGTFDQLMLPTLTSTMFWKVDYLANEFNITARELVPGDYNRDAIVDAADYTFWRKSVGGTDSAADGNGDAIVDDLDFEIWRANYGRVAGGGSDVESTSNIPEPAATAILLWAAAGLLLPRRAAA